MASRPRPSSAPNLPPLPRLAASSSGGRGQPERKKAPEKNAPGKKAPEKKAPEKQAAKPLKVGAQGRPPAKAAASRGQPEEQVLSKRRKLSESPKPWAGEKAPKELLEDFLRSRENRAPTEEDIVYRQVLKDTSKGVDQFQASVTLNFLLGAPSWTGDVSGTAEDAEQWAAAAAWHYCDSYLRQDWKDRLKESKSEAHSASKSMEMLWYFFHNYYGRLPTESDIVFRRVVEDADLQQFQVTVDLNFLPEMPEITGEVCDKAGDAEESAAAAAYRYCTSNLDGVYASEDSDKQLLTLFFCECYQRKPTESDIIYCPLIEDQDAKEYQSAVDLTFISGAPVFVGQVCDSVDKAEESAAAAAYFYCRNDFELGKLTSW